VAADGHIGIVTMAAMKVATPSYIIQQFSNRRRDYYRSLRLFRKYGRGWLSRTTAIEQQSLKIA
jgi:lysozyme family protein